MGVKAEAIGIRICRSHVQQPLSERATHGYSCTCLKYSYLDTSPSYSQSRPTPSTQARVHMLSTRGAKHPPTGRLADHLRSGPLSHLAP